MCCFEPSTGVANHPAEIVIALDRCAVPAEGEIRQQQQGSVLAVLAEIVGATWDRAAELPVARADCLCRAEVRVEGSRGVVVGRRNERAARAGTPVASAELDARQIGFERSSVVALGVADAESRAGEEQG